MFLEAPDDGYHGIMPNDVGFVLIMIDTFDTA